jgi:hypothetical protein
MGTDEGTLARLKVHRQELIGPKSLSTMAAS